jgi:O-antigen ligase
MISTHELRRVGPSRIRTTAWIRDAAAALLFGLGTIFASAAIAYLVASGLWYIAAASLLAIPAFIVLTRYPLAAITIWLLVSPFVVVTPSDAIRQAYWAIHRALPVVTLLLIAFAAVAGLESRKLGRLGWPEVMMAGYVVVSLISIAYTSPAVRDVTYLLYDRVIAPMCLYLIVRLLEPDDQDLRWLTPAVIIVLLTQSAIGLVSWLAPAMVPADWRFDATRTVGSFQDPDVFGTTLVFCAVVIVHQSMSAHRTLLSRVAALLLFVLAIVMVFLTLSRATWIAGLIVLAGIVGVYRAHLKQLVMIVVPVIVLLLASGVVSGQLRFAHERLESEEARESALSRLPVAYAAVRMLEARPVAGWGYGNFDRFSRAFETRVGDLVYPEKAHASHNLFLTILAEQGIAGLVLYLGPMLIWLLRTPSSLPNMPSAGRRLLAILWLVVVSFVVVNSFSVPHSPFGLGLWWITLGLIGSLVQRYRPPTQRRLADGAPMVAGGRP